MGFGCSCDVYLHWRHREIGIAWVRGRTRQVTMALRCAAPRLHQALQHAVQRVARHVVLTV